MAEVNPFRYRGYYYDTESGFYYLQTRYYDPTIRQFINADNYELLPTLSQTIGQLNLYAYANNNPVMFTDETGESITFGVWALVAIFSAATVIGGTSQLISNLSMEKSGDEIWRGVAGAALGTGVNALVLALSMSLGYPSSVLGAYAGAATQTLVDNIEKLICGEEISLMETAFSFAFNFSVTFAGNLLGSKLIPINSGWFKPQGFFSVFSGPYGQRILMQTMLGAELSFIFKTIFHYDRCR